MATEQTSIECTSASDQSTSTTTSGPSYPTSPAPSASKSTPPASPRPTPEATNSSPTQFQTPTTKKRGLLRNDSPGDGFNSKVLKMEETVIGYVHSLSMPRRNRGNTMNYCTFSLQTSEKESREALLYSTDKRPLLQESQTNHTPVKLKYFTYTHDREKIIVNDMTNISRPQQCEYSFQYNESALVQGKPVTILDILNTHKEWDLVTVCAKILSVKEKHQVGSPRKRLNLMEAVLGDGSGTMSLDVWESQIEKVQQGLVYTFANLQVRLWSGRKKVSTTMRTVINPCQDIDLSGVTADDNDSQDKGEEETLQVPNVHSVQKIEQHYKCTHCSKKILQGTCTNVVQCERCGFMMKATTCEKSLSAKIIVLKDGQELSLKVDEVVLKNVFGDQVSYMDVNTLGQKLLFLDSLKITYNNENSIVSSINIAKK